MQALNEGDLVNVAKFRKERKAREERFLYNSPTLLSTQDRRSEAASERTTRNLLGRFLGTGGGAGVKLRGSFHLAHLTRNSNRQCYQGSPSGGPFFCWRCLSSSDWRQSNYLFTSKMSEFWNSKCLTS